MRCKRHPYWGGVGVCASCLRERLLALVAAEEGGDLSSFGSPGDPRLSGGGGYPLPPPLDFPRSVSPYVHRRSADAGRSGHPLFYSTPQVGPRVGGGRSKNWRLSAIASFFRSRSDEADADPVFSVGSGAAATSASSSSSWFSNILRGRRRKKKSRLFSLEEDISGHGGDFSGICRTACRGMSPAAKGREEDVESSPMGSGYWSESPARFKKPAGQQRRRRAGTPSGFAFRLSPLVRACPSASRVDTAGFSGEIRTANRLHLSAAASQDVNRSRKLADFGKFR